MSNMYSYYEAESFSWNDLRVPCIPGTDVGKVIIPIGVKPEISTAYTAIDMRDISNVNLIGFSSKLSECYIQNMYELTDYTSFKENINLLRVSREHEKDNFIERFLAIGAEVSRRLSILKDGCLKDITAYNENAVSLWDFRIYFISGLGEYYASAPADVKAVITESLNNIVNKSRRVGIHIVTDLGIPNDSTAVTIQSLFSESVVLMNDKDIALNIRNNSTKVECVRIPTK